MKSVLIIVDYFGQWPEWFPLFLKSCELNPTIEWRFHTDCELPKRIRACNTTFVQISQGDYYAYVGNMLKISFRPETPYGICSLRPAFGHIYANEIKGFDYFGWGDIDLIYGDIRHFYTDVVLSHNVVSAGGSICTGHLTLLKNEGWLRQAFRCIPNWRQRLEHRQWSWIHSLDEAGMSGLFSPARRVRNQYYTALAGSNPRRSQAWRTRYCKNNYFLEQWSTPFISGPWHDGQQAHPSVWFWNEGHLTNQRDGSREFLYLHFMNYKSPKYINKELYDNLTTWDTLPRCLHFDLEEMTGRIVRIDRRGFHLNNLEQAQRAGYIGHPGH